jgi:5'-nucleotidase / UDP-sugar diphosphatase
MRLVKLGFIVFAAALTACSSQNASFKMSLAHLNDTHSHLAPVAVNLKIDGVATKAEMGGFARLKTVLDKMRADDPHILLLHAGDAVQGTLYFTVFNGSIEFDFLNMLGVDAFALGNHEFDRGAEPIPGWIARSKFPWLSANIDFSAEPAIAPLVRPYLIKEINGDKVAIIGVTTETTPQTTTDAGKAVFNDAIESARRQVDILTARGINKIILLSHLGYIQDKALASKLAGIDIIVGGHSHTLLGDKTRLSAIGLIPEGPYPTELKAADGKRVLVLQAWKWGQMLGRLKVTFTPDGEVGSYSSKPVIPVGGVFSRNGTALLPDAEEYRGIVRALDKTETALIVDEDPAVAAALLPYTAGLQKFSSDVVAVAADDITVGLNSGPGPLGADSMLAALPLPGAQLAILNYGGVRRDLMAGNISVGDVLEVMPFANTLVLIDLTGAELKKAMEENIDYMVTKYGAESKAMPYLGGATMTVLPTAANGSRVTAIAIKGGEGVYQPVQPAKIYRAVVNSFTAGGGDGFATIMNTKCFRSDTGIIDSDAFRDYLKKLGRVSNPTEKRIIIMPAE